MLELCSLASGSSGNCFYVSNGKDQILVDAGISCRQVVERLNGIGKKIEDINGIFITHEHGDHIRGIEVLSKKYNIPVFLNKGTLANSYLNIKNKQLIKTGQEMNYLGFQIMPFSKSHDCFEPVSFMIKNGTKKVGIITDIGYACENVNACIAESDALILESNHDIEMLKNGPYPIYLKRRIAGKEGHISNNEAALAVLEHGKKNLQHVFLAHLSLNNNTPELAMDSFNRILSERNDLNSMKRYLTYREKTSELVRVE